LDWQAALEACSLALARAGSSMAARMAMMAMTTNNSIRVNPVSRCFMPQLSALGQAASMYKKIAG
jgi:hypothetical protein